MKTCSVLLGTVIAIFIPAAHGDLITVNSGAGVTFLDSGSVNTDFSSAFTGANFTAAQTGTSAFVLTGTPSWISSLPAAPAAKWLGTDGTSGTGSGDTAMYAVSFNIPDAFVSGSLTLNYAVDNELGGSNAGITSMGTRSHRPLGLGLSPVSLLTWTLNVARTSFTEPIGFI